MTVRSKAMVDDRVVEEERGWRRKQARQPTPAHEPALEEFEPEEEEPEEPQAPRKRGRGVQWSVGLALLAFGVPSWFIGGRYTIEGWVIWINRLLGWFGVTDQLPLPLGWTLLCLVVVASLIYSRVEVAHRPWKRVSKRWVLAAPLAWVAWALIVGTDLGSTYQGLIVPPAAGAEQWMKDLAASDALSGLAAIVLTFAPEWLILGGWKLLKG